MTDLDDESGTPDGARPDGAGDRTALAASLLEDFARDTGLVGDAPADRYLWTDAFAVCTWLGLAAATGEDRHRELALRLIERVHRVLGRHRDDDDREGWISALGEEEGARHPTAGGLRIGKEKPERGPSEPFDPQAEWERDGQYYHYLVRWAHALDRAHRATDEAKYRRWAVELMEAAHAAFVHDGEDRPGPVSGGGPRGNGGSGSPGIHWKMSVDLSRPLVPTEGQHDPLDGLVAVRVLRAGGGTGGHSGGAPASWPGDAAPPLEREERELGAMCRGRHWQSDDPLGIGGLLTDAWWLAQLASRPSPASGAGPADEELLGTLVEDAAASLRILSHGPVLSGRASRRLAFRELGLSIGLAGAERLLETAAVTERLPFGHVEELHRHLSLRDAIESFWREDESREAGSWTGHREINRVMLAASLAPGGYLGL